MRPLWRDRPDQASVKTERGAVAPRPRHERYGGRHPHTRHVLISRRHVRIDATRHFSAPRYNVDLPRSRRNWIAVWIASGGPKLPAFVTTGIPSTCSPPSVAHGIAGNTSPRNQLVRTPGARHPPPAPPPPVSTSPPVRVSTSGLIAAAANRSDTTAP